MISETANSSHTKMIGINLHAGEYRIGYSNFTPNPLGTRVGVGGQNSTFVKSKNFANKSYQVCLRNGKNCISPLGHYGRFWRFLSQNWGNVFVFTDYHFD